MKLTDGAMTKAIGILKNIKNKTFILSYKVAFVVMDFQRQTNLRHLRQTIHEDFSVGSWSVLQQALFAKRRPCAKDWSLNMESSSYEWTRVCCRIWHTNRIIPVNKLQSIWSQGTEWSLQDPGYVPLLEPKYSKNWMHLLATLDLLTTRRTHITMFEEELQKVVSPINTITIVEPKAREKDDEGKTKLRSKPRVHVNMATLTEFDGVRLFCEFFLWSFLGARRKLWDFKELRGGLSTCMQTQSTLSRPGLR